jgi:hypothetical protein
MKGRGSEWAVWDLHIHTPCSIEQHYGGDQLTVWTRYLDALEALPEDVQVLGITDYYFPDGYERVMTARESGKLSRFKLIVPILEFRIDTFASAPDAKLSRVNLHIAFNVAEQDWRAGVRRIREEFIECLLVSKHCPGKRLSKENLAACASDGRLRTGFAELVPETEKVLDLVEEAWTEDTLLLLGFREWNELDKGRQAKHEKRALFDSVHGFLTASRADLLEQKKRIISAFGEKALLHSLDIHDFEAFERYECRSWLKAEPTFEGLRQALALPAERISHDLRPRKLVSTAARTEAVIESIQIKSSADDGEWFDRVGKLPLNPGLVAIIGNKGMGKTALADAICAAGNCADAGYSFLTKSKFLKHRASKKYTAEIRYLDGSAGSSSFRDVAYKPGQASRVIYLSQAFVENLCDDIDGTERLQAQIDRVIFSHIPVETAGGHASLASLVGATAESYGRRQSELRVAIQDMNRKIVDAERALSNDSRSRLQSAVDSLRRKLQEHIVGKPPEPALEPMAENVLHALLKRRGARQQTERKRMQDLEINLKSLGTRRQRLKKVRQDVEALRTAWDSIDAYIQGDDFLRSHLSLDGVFPLDIRFERLDELQTQVEEEIESKRTTSSRVGSLIDSLQRSIERIQGRLQGKQKAHAAAIVGMQDWQRQHDDLIGAVEVPGSLRHAEAQLQDLETHWPALLAELEGKRRALCGQLWQTIVEKEQALSALYQPAQRRAQELAAQFMIPVEEFIAFDSTIRLTASFAADFLSRVNKNRSGAFHGSDNAQRQIDLLIQRVLEDHDGSWLQLPFLIEAALKPDSVVSPSDGTQQYRRDNWVEQLAGGETARASFYDFLFSLEYVQGRFGITYGGKPIEVLSPGDRGLLLLVFFLLVDTSLKPIVIDQPEENVDNETIYYGLVQFIKAAKQERQIIIVTHNPNLAVVCDAEQVICAFRAKKNHDLIEYRAGGLESELKDDALRVLEGTRPAFVTRKRKYGL